MSLYTVGYNFQPGDQVWVVNKLAQSIHHGICKQVDVRIYQDAGTPTVTPAIIIDHLLYWVLLDNQVGSVKVLPEDAFFSIEEALAGLSSDITPTPSPTPTMTPTPLVTSSVTPTPDVTPTNTPTVTPTMTGTPDVTPTNTPSVTPTSSATVTPTPTMTGTPDVTPTVTPDVTPTVTPTGTPDVTQTTTPTPTVTPTITSTLTPTPSVTPSTSQPALTYATWNPADNSGLVLSNGNLTTTTDVTGYNTVKATISKNSGKCYFEVRGTTLTAEARCYIGLNTAAAVSSSVGDSVNGWALRFNNSTKVHSGSQQAHGTTPLVDNDLAYIAVDFDAGKIWLGSSADGWVGADPANGTGETYTFTPNLTLFPTISLFSLIGNVIGFTANFGQNTFNGVVPAGFNAGIYT